MMVRAAVPVKMIFAIFMAVSRFLKHARRASMNKKVATKTPASTSGRGDADSLPNVSDSAIPVVRTYSRAMNKLVKELSRISVLPPHHRRISCRFLSRNHCSLGSSTPFSTASVKRVNLTVRRSLPVLPDKQTS
jgi:hypothetical protein